MKILTKLFIMPVLCCIISCNTNEALDERLLDVDDPLLEEFGNTEMDDEGGESGSINDPKEAFWIKENLEECLFSDLTLQSNRATVIECLVDLEGKTIDVPEGVTFEFDGGYMINGTLNFSSGGKIDGELLNSELELNGDVKLTSEEFEFIPEKWGIIETDSKGTLPNQRDAFNNHIVLQKTIDLAKLLGVSTVKIGEMNAYFDSERIVKAVLSLPSNFNLKMSNETVLRTFPTKINSNSSKMIKIDNQDNVTINGGVIIGDRLLHGVSQMSGTLVDIVGSRNVTVQNMNLSLGITGLTVYGHSWFDFPDQSARPYIPSEDIFIKNNKFESNQANNLSITDGYRILIEGNELYNAGIELESSFGTSEGIAPRIGIVIEPAYDGVGFTQRIEDVDIINNKVDGSQKNAILALGVYRVKIDGNIADSTVGWTSARFATVTNNIVNGGGISGGFPGTPGFENVIAHNIVNNAATGIYLTSEDIDVYENTITNSTVGIMMASLTNSKIHDNIIKNSLSNNNWGINAQFYVDDVEVYNNEISITNGLPMQFIGINREENQIDYSINLRENEYMASRNLTVTNSNGIHFDNNNFKNIGISFGDSSNSSLTKNVINSKTDTGLNINRSTGSVKNILINNNIIANTREERLNGYGVRINIVGSNFLKEDSNIKITNNTISSLGNNYSFHSSNFDNLTIINNTIVNESENRESLYFNGNNSIISDNTLISSNKKEAVIEGNNNSVVDNMGS